VLYTFASALALLEIPVEGKKGACWVHSGHAAFSWNPNWAPDWQRHVWGGFDG